MKGLISTIVITLITLTNIAAAQNILNDAFRPSVDRDFVIDIGNSRDSVGSNVFEGGLSVEANINTPKTCYIRSIVIQATENTCASEDGTRLPYTYTVNDGSTQLTTNQCVKNEPMAINTTQESCESLGNLSFGECKAAGRTVHVNNVNTCTGTVFGDWRTIKGQEQFIEAYQRAPLFVRIAQLLLRITIALSVTFIIYNAIVYALSFGDSSKASNAQKKLLNIAIGVIIALSSVGIIYLIQSIIMQTIRY